MSSDDQEEGEEDNGSDFTVANYIVNLFVRLDLIYMYANIYIYRWKRLGKPK